MYNKGEKSIECTSSLFLLLQWPASAHQIHTEVGSWESAAENVEPSFCPKDLSERNRNIFALDVDCLYRGTRFRVTKISQLLTLSLNLLAQIVFKHKMWPFFVHWKCSRNMFPATASWKSARKLSINRDNIFDKCIAQGFCFIPEHRFCSPWGPLKPGLRSPDDQWRLNKQKNPVASAYPTYTHDCLCTWTCGRL